MAKRPKIWQLRLAFWVAAGFWSTIITKIGLDKSPYGEFRRFEMNKSKLSAILLLAAIAVPSVAQASHHHRYRGYYGHPEYHALPYPISYLHNYGPGQVPGTFAFYDGPSTNVCFQGAAAYRGQDRRRHPCF